MRNSASSFQDSYFRFTKARFAGRFERGNQASG